MKPIVIIANYRTGSTAYSIMLANQYNLVNFAEPHYQPELFEQLSTMMLESERNFVLKIMPDQIKENLIYQQALDSDCYKIKLTRENKVEQIVSHYIARLTNKWNSSNPNIRGQMYNVPVSKVELANVINYIQKIDQQLDNLNIKFDQELTYESILESIENATVNKLPKKLIPPSNYEELKQCTAQLLGELAQTVI